MAYENDLSGFIAAVKEEATRYGFTEFPLTDGELEAAYNEGLDTDDVYGIVCDMNAGLSFGKALEIARVRNVASNTWVGILPTYRDIIEGDSADDKSIVWCELRRMAELADLYVASLSPEAGAGEEEV